MKKTKPRARLRSSQTVTDLVRSNNDYLIKAAQPISAFSEVVDISVPLSSSNDHRPSSLFAGTDLHQSIAAAIRGLEPSPEFAPFAKRLVRWLREIRVTHALPEFRVESPSVRGQCDVFVRGGIINRHGVIEVKACNELPTSPRIDDRLQVALYAYAVSSASRREVNGQWAALVYCALPLGAIRIFIWNAIRVHANAVGLAIPMAT